MPKFSIYNRKYMFFYDNRFTKSTKKNFEKLSLFYHI